MNESEFKKKARRSCFTGALVAVLAVAAWAGIHYRTASEDEEDIPVVLRKVLNLNEKISKKIFSPTKMARTFSEKDVTPIRHNGDIGLTSPIDLKTWRLHLKGHGKEVVLTLDEIKKLPKVDMIAELKCIEGWSTVVHWGGVKLSDVLAKYDLVNPAQDAYVGMVTPDEEYYVGIDLATALHPQTLLAFEMNGEPLSLIEGAPLRLATPLKYGIKNIKRIGTITVTTRKPADYWAERGYDYYAGF